MHLSREILLFIATTHYNKQSSLVKDRETACYEGIQRLAKPTDKKDFCRGHVGIYIGNGQVIHNLSGTVKVQSLESWVEDFKGFAWGWENGKNLLGKNQYNCVGWFK